MLVNEHLSKTLFAQASIPVPSGVLISADTDLDRFDPGFVPPFVLKSQVLAGGRGKAGGIVRIDDPRELGRAAAGLFTLEIRGELPPYLRLEPAVSIERECYLSFAVSRTREALVLTAAPGGVEVEAAARAGQAVVQEVDLGTGPEAHQVREAFFALGLPKERFKDFDALVGNLFRAVAANGLLLAEINPLALTPEGLVALDGKVEIDDNYADIHPELERFFEPAHLSAEERLAREHSLSFVSLPGWVGLLANGAGLAMATMDQLNFSGLPAANFLDLGGAANEKRMERALDLLFGDKGVRAVFINLFGGILSCASVARALSNVLGGREPEKPMVVRMAGNGAEEGREIMGSLCLSGVTMVSDMAEALDALSGLGPAGEKASLSGMHLDESRTFKAALDVTKQEPHPRPMDFRGDTPIIVQGITGKVAGFHTARMQAYGANVVAGVTPFKGGREAAGVPVFDTVRQAAERFRPEVSIIFVPGAFAADAILEAAAAGIAWIVCITEGIPQQDMLQVVHSLKGSGSRLVGPNTPGVIVPGRTKIGIMPEQPFTPGPVAVFSRSGTLTYEACARLSAAGIGQSVCVGMGGDPFVGVRFADLLDMVRDDPETSAVAVLGEIGGNAEESLAEYVASTGYPKPVVSFVAGLSAPPGKRLGHAGAILEESGGAVESKLARLAGAGIEVCSDLSALAEAAGRIVGRI